MMSATPKPKFPVGSRVEDKETHETGTVVRMPRESRGSTHNWSSSYSTAPKTESCTIRLI
jgi:hypothetical protein